MSIGMGHCHIKSMSAMQLLHVVRGGSIWNATHVRKHMDEAAAARGSEQTNGAHIATRIKGQLREKEAWSY